MCPGYDERPTVLFVKIHKRNKDVYRGHVPIENSAEIHVEFVLKNLRGFAGLKRWQYESILRVHDRSVRNRAVDNGKNVGHFEKSQEPFVVPHHPAKDTQLARGFESILANVGHDGLLNRVHSIACFLDYRVVDNVRDN